MRTIKNLVNGKVYVYLADEETALRFLKDAESEGFTLGGKKPTECKTSDIIAIENEENLCYVGFTGRVAFGTASGRSSGIKCVNYKKYILGDDDYIIV